MIYFDNAATTKVDNDVLQEMIPYFCKTYGNPSSLHKCGKDARQAIENARFEIAKVIGAAPNEIIFTSGATESNNLAIRSCVELCNKEAQEKLKNLEEEEIDHLNKEELSNFENSPDGIVDFTKHFILSSIEHKSVLNLQDFIKENGHEVDLINCLPSGQVDIKHLKDLIKENTVLVSCIWINNETGIIQPIEEIAHLCKERNVLFHTDATQAFGKIPIDVNKIQIDLLSFSGHKLHGPKGVGGLYKNRHMKLECQISGGSQENNYRSGTENVPGIVGLAVAAKKMNEDENKHKYFDVLENYFLKKLDCSKIPCSLNGDIDSKVPWMFNISFLNFLAVDLEEKLQKFCFSKASACAKGSELSYVLKEMNLPEELIERSIRISFSKYTTLKQIDCFFRELEKLNEKAKK